MDEFLFAVGGWIVAALTVLMSIRHGRRRRAELERFRGIMKRLLQALEGQTEPLNRLVALGSPGSEVRDEAVSALQVVNTAVGDVLRAEPSLKPERTSSSTEDEEPSAS
jgi:hypothetical protein